jgi:hypothetical protein
VVNAAVWFSYFSSEMGFLNKEGKAIKGQGDNLDLKMSRFGCTITLRYILRFDHHQGLI